MNNKLENILEYQGELSQSLIIKYTDFIGDIIENIGTRSIISTIFIEQSQNMMNYSKSKDRYCTNIVPSGYIKIEENIDYCSYIITSKNIISLQDKEKIEKKLIEIESLDRDGIRKRYRELRRSGINTHVKGGGVGFYEIAKIVSFIEYDFKAINEDKFYFRFCVTHIPNKKG